MILTELSNQIISLRERIRTSRMDLADAERRFDDLTKMRICPVDQDNPVVVQVLGPPGAVALKVRVRRLRGPMGEGEGITVPVETAAWLAGALAERQSMSSRSGINDIVVVWEGDEAAIRGLSIQSMQLRLTEAEAQWVAADLRERLGAV